ncbi:ABC transporter C family protein [Cavenderia fasciculata]|uniref:ABC transporter C family protein n=1 Tax=Cavenderia fasciculata TaxID=261658 RepID=F4PKM8_CACFS|nr:ABC transporter C family protein [Cavenderia fasciculata]EGG24152.1 ABC transporter C family protein [Cavenderia fasciculata]|eukprot:XP_004362003.1 ABC transporter C family protein [Cavenderia fasciculata]
MAQQDKEEEDGSGGGGIQLTPIDSNNNNNSITKPTVEEKKVIGFGGKKNPFDTASLFSLATFAWIETFAWHCFKNILEQSHLYDLAECDKSTQVGKKIKVEWEKELLKKEEETKQYWKASMRAYGPYYCLGLTFYAVYCASQFVGPQLLSRIIKWVFEIQYVPDTTVDPNMGYYYALAMFGSAMVGSFCNYQSNLISARVGNWMRSGMVLDIYTKSLKLDTAARRKTSTGEVVNLMSNDAQRVAEVFLMFNNGIFAPLQIIVCIVLMYQEIGWPTFVGLGVMLAVAPLNAIVAKSLLKLRFQMIKNSDKRLRLINEILQFIKIIKLYAWEVPFAAKVTNSRNLEVKALAKFSYIRACLIFIVSAVPTIVSILVFTTVFKADTGVSADKVFSALAYLNILRMPLSFLPLIIAMLAQVKVATDRIAAFLLLSERKPVEEINDPNTADGIYVENANFNWDSTKDDSFKLNNINFVCTGPTLTMVVGSVGSGKSSLCQSVLGDMDLVEGRLRTKGRIAYVPQQAWIVNASLRANILYGKAFDQDRYEAVIEACALKRDLEMFPQGDFVEIGERGINLSGGQKQRVSIARAVYNNADIYILDDPLSAVDAHVGKHIFQKCISGFLSDKTVILVANQLNYLPFANNVLVMNKNTISEHGTYQEIMESRGDFSQVLSNYGMGQDSTPVDTSSETSSLEVTGAGAIPKEKTVVVKLDEAGGNTTPKPKFVAATPVTGEKGKLIQREERETGSVSMAVYGSYFKTGGILLFLWIVLIFALENGSGAMLNWWLSDWSNAMQFQNGGDYNLTSDQYLFIYIGIGIGSVIASGLRNIFFFSYTVRAARRIHEKLFAAILRCPMWFFDTTPMGRIINRFTRDQDVIDNLIAPSIGQYMGLFMQIIASLIIISIITPYLLIPLAPIIVIYYLLQTYYRYSSRELQRLVSISRSPIFSHFTESLVGASTIRAYGREQESVLTNQRLLDDNNKSYMMLQTMNNWLGLRLDFLGNLIVFFSVVFVTLARDTITIASIGLSISYALSITASLNRATLQGADLETKMNSVERINFYIDGPEEAAQVIQNSRPPANWPPEGGIVLDNVVMRYREGLDPVLKSISCTIAPKEKIGIVGRTGSGKSSLVLALFRLVELSEGSISIDGDNIAKFGLTDLRKNLAILPQDACLFAGTLRMNLDPFGESDDDLLWRVLEDIQLNEKVKELEGGLDSLVTDNGDNWSVGQRQLICLGRALLRRPKILVLDEATASVDSHSDSLIQTTIKEKFNDCTIITIAHRLNTIIDYDRIMVMDAGVIAEFDTPDKLLQNQTGLFSWLIDETGQQNSQLLRKLASQSSSLKL